MDKFDRIYELHSLLKAHRHPVSLQAIQEKLECSESTARRIVDALRDRFAAPIEYDRERNGWHYDHAQRQLYELPGLWFSADELYALTVSHNLLANLQPDILSSYISPLKNRIENILQHKRAGHPDIARRIRIFQQAARPTDLDQFRRIAGATIERRQLRILYHGRERDQTSERTVSPQRLTYYRSNWYLDAWCHLRDGLRTFSLDRAHVVEVNDTPAEDIADETLDAHFASTYGIFAGPPKQIAVLRFTPTAARWVADEHWHPDQQGEVLPDGSYELHIPYSDPRELVMDILKYGEEVEVVAPEALREQVRQKLRAALDNYK